MVEINKKNYFCMWLTINMATSYRMKVLQHMLLLSFVFMLLITNIRGGNKDDNEVKEKFKKKNIADYTDVDLERLYDQWEVCPLGPSWAVSDVDVDDNDDDDDDDGGRCR